MNNWWLSLPWSEKIYWVLAIPFTVLFVIQAIALLIGIGDSGFDFDGIDGADGIGEMGDFDGDGLSDIIPLGRRLFSLRNIIYFFTAFSWCGIINIRAGRGIILSFIISFLVGFVVIAILTAVLTFLMKATSNGIMDKNNAIGERGKVYLRIPKKGEGVGSVNVVIQGALRELEAASENEEILTGDEIEVTGLREDGVLVVKKINLLKGE